MLLYHHTFCAPRQPVGRVDFSSARGTTASVYGQRGLIQRMIMIMLYRSIIQSFSLSDIFFCKALNHIIRDVCSIFRHLSCRPTGRVDPEAVVLWHPYGWARRASGASCLFRSSPLVVTSCSDVMSKNANEDQVPTME